MLRTHADTHTHARMHTIQFKQYSSHIQMCQCSSNILIQYSLSVLVQCQWPISIRTRNNTKSTNSAEQVTSVTRPRGPENNLWCPGLSVWWVASQRYMRDQITGVTTQESEVIALSHPVAKIPCVIPSGQNRQRGFCFKKSSSPTVFESGIRNAVYSQIHIKRCEIGVWNNVI